MILYHQELGILLSYNPDEPRGADGKWSGGLGEKENGAVAKSGEKFRNQDLSDSFYVLKQFADQHNLTDKWPNMAADFKEAVNKAKVEQLATNKLQIHHDYGRRPKGPVQPIIVAKYKNGELNILDGQHRLLVAKDRGMTDIKALVINLPMINREPGLHVYDIDNSHKSGSNTPATKTYTPPATPKVYVPRISSPEAPTPPTHQTHWDSDSMRK